MNSSVDFKRELASESGLVHLFDFRSSLFSESKSLWVVSKYELETVSEYSSVLTCEFKSMLVSELKLVGASESKFKVVPRSIDPFIMNAIV